MSVIKFLMRKPGSFPDIHVLRSFTEVMVVFSNLPNCTNFSFSILCFQKKAAISHSKNDMKGCCEGVIGTI